MSSEKVYREVPHEEEEVESLAGSLNTETTENTERAASASTWRRMRVGDELPCKEKARRLVARYWPWAAHGILLTTSITFFALAFCLRYNNAKNDLFVTENYSSYCTSPGRVGTPRKLTRAQHPPPRSSSTTPKDTTSCPS